VCAAAAPSLPSDGASERGVASRPEIEEDDSERKRKAHWAGEGDLPSVTRAADYWMGPYSSFTRPETPQATRQADTLNNVAMHHPIKARMHWHHRTSMEKICMDGCIT
jgi:hypothetical protein